MKVKGRNDIPDLKTVTESLQQDAVKILTKRKDSPVAANGIRSEGGFVVQDRADVETGRAIRNELDPAAMILERQKKVAEL